MVMSSFLMNSSPAAYAAADPKFPPSEEYSQGNYIPDYYGHSVSGQTGQPPPHQTSHYGYHHHHHLYGTPLADQPGVTVSQSSHHYGHHVGVGVGGVGVPPGVHPSHGQYYSPCAASLAGQHGQSQLGQVHHLGSQLSQNRVPSPQLHRSPSPRSQAVLGLGEPPSPPDCAIGSGSDSGAGPNPVIYPWMKKVHVNQGEPRAEGS